jgi:hypothetical protein
MTSTTNLHATKRSTFKRYLTIVALTLASAVALVFVQVLNLEHLDSRGGADHFAAVPLNEDYSWYLNFGGRNVPEIQDLDLYYHNIGHSIDEAKQADIVLLGPSFVAYALDPTLLREFGERHRIKIYNMAFIGVRSGEFSRQIIERWGLHPKLWIINVDDQFEHFFNPSLTLTIGPRSTPIAATNYGRLRGWLNVASRNIRWRIETYWAHWSTGAPLEAPGIYRRTNDGAAYLDFNPRYRAADNSVLHVDRDQNCHTTEAVIKQGRTFLTDVGGKVEFMLVPHSQYCPQQARELGQALGVETLLAPPNLPVTTVDGGGHLDHNGAVIFTTNLLSSLERSNTFRTLFSTQPEAHR